MLALGTHEPHFKVLREDVFGDDKKGCRICSKTGHIAAHCKGKANDGGGNNDLDHDNSS